MADGFLKTDFMKLETAAAYEFRTMPETFIHSGNGKRYKESTPTWIAKRNVINKMRLEMGEKEYMRRIREDEIDAARRQCELKEM